MVGPLLLLKMLHCKRMNRRKSKKYTCDDNSSTSRDNPKEYNVKMEVTEDEDIHLCRVCLKEGNIPIYGHNDFEDISNDLNNIAGINVTFDDEYPKYICEPCHSLLKGAILLKRTAQQTEQLLQNPTNNILSYNDNDNDFLNDSDDSTDMNYKYEVKKVEQEDTVQKKPYHCKKCNIDFETFEEITDHRMSLEHENMRVPCPVCGNMYTTRYLKKHLLYHKGEAGYMCDICGKKFVICGQFNRHRMTHFIDELPFKCSLCPYRGRFSESLKMHMRSHTGEKPYQCPQCPTRFFVNKSNLNKHMLTHKNDHDFKCSQCQRGFYTQKDLDLHYKVDHSGIKEHVCNVCGKAFGHRKQMMKHQLKVHKRDKMRSGRTPLYIIQESRKLLEPQLNDMTCS